MSYRKRDSGAKYKRNREEKEEKKEAAVLKKTRKLDTFFITKQKIDDIGRFLVINFSFSIRLF